MLKLFVTANAEVHVVLVLIIFPLHVTKERWLVESVKIALKEHLVIFVSAQQEVNHLHLFHQLR